MAVTKRKFTVILELEEDGGFSVYCPALPGCVSQGDTRQSAIDSIKEAIRLYQETLQERKAEMAPRLVKEAFKRSNEGAPHLYEESPEVIAEEIRHILGGRQEDGLPFGGVSTETVEVELPVHVSA
jgi:predicted RNase H-like HicB family nuclease